MIGLITAWEEAMAMAETAELVRITSRDGTPIGLWKTGSGPSLVAVHGTAADHRAWDRMVPLLSSKFTVYAMDRRGRGASGDSPDYEIEREFDDVAAAVDSLPAPVHLYGHSFGGRVCLEGALRASNLGRLVIYEGGGVKPPGLRLIPEELISQLEDMIAAGEAEEALSFFMLRSGAVTQKELPVLRAQPAWAARVAAAPTIPRELRAIDAYEDDLQRTTTLHVPTLLVAGSETEARRREMFARLGEFIPNARLVLLPGQRHAAHQTAPDLLASVLREFLDG